jgi:trk system potassium uptake protein TrkA
LVGTASPVAGKTLRDMELPRECVLVAVIRSSDLLIPRGDTVIRANDKLIAITNVEQLQKLDDMLGTEG